MKYTVQVADNGNLRFVALAPDRSGQHQMFEAQCDATNRTAALVDRSADYSHVDATAPLFIRNYYGDGHYELLDHLTVPHDATAFHYLAAFTRRVLAAVGGAKGQCIDDRNRTAFWKVVDFLGQNGPVDLLPDMDPFVTPATNPAHYNF